MVPAPLTGEVSISAPLMPWNGGGEKRGRGSVMGKREDSSTTLIQGVGGGGPSSATCNLMQHPQLTS